MKIAFLVAAHTDPEQLENLFDRLNKNNFFKPTFFLHIDAKADITLFERVISNSKWEICLTQKRINVIRCGISQVESHLELMKTVINTGERFDRYVLITGQDYPIVTDEDFYNRMLSDIEFMRGYKVTGTSMNKKICKFYFYNKYLTGSKMKGLIRKGLQFLCSFIKKRDYVIFQGNVWDVWYSSAYFAVSHQLFLELYEKGLDKKYFRYFKTSICSDEMYFITIAANSEFKNRLEILNNGSSDLLDNSSISYFNYQNRPIILTEKDYYTLKNSGRMFGRKFSSLESKKLIDLLDKDNS